MSIAALLIGINYTKDERFRLNGCWNDAMILYSILTSKFAFPLDSVKLLIDNDSITDNTSKANIMINLLDLARKSWSEQLEKVVISYSGHGTYIPDVNGDEIDGKDECLCPSDFTTSGFIKDDDLLTILKTFNPKTRIYIVADCCHSGTIIDLPYNLGIENTKVNRDISQFIVAISGCMDPQTSAEVYDSKMKKYGGVLTSSLIHILSNNSIGLLDLHNKLTETITGAGYTQKPIISCSRVPNNKIYIFN
jgi:hypothetical protein